MAGASNITVNDSFRDRTNSTSGGNVWSASNDAQEFAEDFRISFARAHCRNSVFLEQALKLYLLGAKRRGADAFDCIVERRPAECLRLRIVRDDQRCELLIGKAVALFRTLRSRSDSRCATANFRSVRATFSWILE